MALSANRDVSRFTDQDIRSWPMAAGANIYRGGLVGLHPVSGLLKPYEAPDLFVGIAYEAMDNTSGAASAKACRVQTGGDYEMPLASVAAADAGRAVYALADDTLALAGHPDAFVGRVVGRAAANTAVVRLRSLFERPAAGDRDTQEYVYHAGGVHVTGETAGNGPVGHYQVRSALGLGTTLDAAVGGISLAFDATAEVAQASIESPVVLSITRGISFTALLNAEAIGDNAALDMDWGIANVLSATTRANLDDASLTRHARFHMDGNSADIRAESDDDVTDVSATDTTIDNVTTPGAVKRFDIIARPTGLVEFWIDAARVLAATTFGVGAAAGVFGGFINIEKTSDDTVAEIVCTYLRVAGGRA